MNQFRRDALVTTVNACEVLERLLAAGNAPTASRELLDAVELEVVPFDLTLAEIAASMKAITRRAGLSLGDRACLALGRHLSLPVMTADRDWLKVDVGVEVRLIRP